jgi:rod shape-determining protein MreD
VRIPWIFGGATFLAGWLLHALLGYALPGWLSPHWLLLFTLGFGSLGRTDLAQTLGFFWGLGLDVFGLSLFGSQAWLLCLAGFLSGRFSRQLNAEKLVTQETLALLGTAFFWAGFALIEEFFRPSGYRRDPQAAAVALDLLFNAAVAPGVFWAARRWTDAFGSFGPEAARG